VFNFSLSLLDEPVDIGIRPTGSVANFCAMQQRSMIGSIGFGWTAGDDRVQGQPF
jgi:hypothetical protein